MTRRRGVRQERHRKGVITEEVGGCKEEGRNIKGGEEMEGLETKKNQGGGVQTEERGEEDQNIGQIFRRRKEGGGGRGSMGDSRGAERGEIKKKCTGREGGKWLEEWV